MGVLALSGHAMTARWHLGAITGGYFWRVLVLSPEVLVFLFFMITDPKTIPSGRSRAASTPSASALLAVLLIAPQRTEFAIKVALLGALRSSAPRDPCSRGPHDVVRGGDLGSLAILARRPRRRGGRGGSRLRRHSRRRRPFCPADGDGVPAVDSSARLPAVTVASSKGVASRIDPATARQIARDVLADLGIEGDALRLRNASRAASSSGGPRLADLFQRIRVPAGGAVAVPSYAVDRMRLSVEFGERQGPPLVLADIAGTMRFATYEGRRRASRNGPPSPSNRRSSSSST